MTIISIGQIREASSLAALSPSVDRSYQLLCSSLIRKGTLLSCALSPPYLDVEIFNFMSSMLVGRDRSQEAINLRLFSSVALFFICWPLLIGKGFSGCIRVSGVATSYSYNYYHVKPTNGKRIYIQGFERLS